MKIEQTISVIVPVYNVEKYLRKCVESIIEQTYPALEIILIDDGSQDDSPKICDELAVIDTRIKVIHQTNGGLSRARNAGIRASHGEWLVFVDSDDHVSARLCEAALESALKYDADITIFNLAKTYDGKVIPIVDDGMKSGILDKMEAMRALNVDSIGNYAWNKIYKRKLFDDIYFPDGRMLEDIGTTYRLFDKAERISYVKDVLYYYVQHRDSIMHKNSVQKVRDQFELRYDQYLFLKERYERASESAEEALVRSAITYCVYFSDLGDKDEGYCKAYKVIKAFKRYPPGSRLKVMILCRLLTGSQALFNIVSRAYIKSIHVS